MSRTAEDIADSRRRTDAARARDASGWGGEELAAWMRALDMCDMADDRDEEQMTPTHWMAL